MYEVFHLWTKETIDSVITGWLKPLKQLAQEKIIDLQDTLRRKLIDDMLAKDLIDFRISTLYFRLEEPPKRFPWVSILVDEKIVNVLNNNLEYKSSDIYLRSKMTLETFLHRSKWLTNNLHPITAMPIDDPNLLSTLVDTRSYSPEIVLQNMIITNFHRYTRWE